MILHTINALPSSSAFRDCIKVICAGDALILMGDGVYAALKGTHYCDELQAMGIELFVLAVDAQLAGVTESVASIGHIDMDSFVALTERFPRLHAWY